MFCYPTFVIQYSLLLLKGYIFLPTFIKSASDNCSLFLLSHSIKGPLPYYKHNTVLSCQRAKARKPLIYLLVISNHQYVNVCKVYFTSLGTSSVNINYFCHIMYVCFQMCSLRENIKDYSKAYEDTKAKITNCPKDVSKQCRQSRLCSLFL